MVKQPRFAPKIPFENDLMNKNNFRNMRNTPRKGFNCGGYALGTFSWYNPCGEINPTNMYDFDTVTEAETLTRMCVLQMLHDFDDLRVIEKINQLEPNEYAIAFRLSSDGDFHYLKRSKRGHWIGKQGGSNFITSFRVHEVFHEDWGGRYDGPIALFAKKYQ